MNGPLVAAVVLAVAGPIVIAATGQQPAPDVALCSVERLQQMSREGSRAALAAATTSWNVGNQRLAWHERPDPRHPFIVLNLYRIKNEIFEQIAQSWVKHGFYALSSSQCGGGCKDVTDGTELGVDCTDTYVAELNADPENLAPRFEVNPWTGAWNASTSHFATPHTHQSLDHKMTVDDDDLNPTTNPNATFVLEAYYVHFEDTNVMNSAGWKTVVVNGQPGGLWRFQLAPATGVPTPGFAVSAWQGAVQTVAAIDNPPKKGSSPDGRAIIAAKSTLLRPGTWRYSYAILNVDMDRQVGSVEFQTGSAARDLQFHAPPHTEQWNAPGESRIDNAPWTGMAAPDTVSWRTKTNPIRWGTAYTFSFSSDFEPSEGNVTLGLYKSGTPTTVSARTIVPRRR